MIWGNERGGHSGVTHQTEMIQLHLGVGGRFLGWSVARLRALSSGSFKEKSEGLKLGKRRKVKIREKERKNCEGPNK